MVSGHNGRPSAAHFVPRYPNMLRGDGKQRELPSDYGCVQEREVEELLAVLVKLEDVIRKRKAL
eukprot:CAMPEP_0177783976 /NCGR_PEP_ID=MMETSP0491_2-20121128/19423_1 /TAXON_ID=63592 /ORGANISM="Tetraselmis chuii, Strain PLY429" /LENGTH=63 /DNA_ID=CAMNT_0019304649 /DNA_START=91 /DNA_END=279 /DNA_ORIENTATION=-